MKKIETANTDNSNVHIPMGGGSLWLPLNANEVVSYLIH